MKKYLFTILSIALLLLPFSVQAGTKKVDGEEYEYKNLAETLAEEEIEKEFSNYSENDNQITIYLFRGKGCGYCRAFLTFLNSITNDYGKYFKLVSFETWYDEANWGLFNRISYFKDGTPAQGVPYVIIGEKVFGGYAESYNEDIKKAITDLYNTPKSERFDIFATAEESGLITLEELEKLYPADDGSSGDTAATSYGSSTDGSVKTLVIVFGIVNIVLVAGGFVALFIYNENRFKSLKRELRSSKTSGGSITKKSKK